MRSGSYGWRFFNLGIFSPGGASDDGSEASFRAPGVSLAGSMMRQPLHRTRRGAGAGCHSRLQAGMNRSFEPWIGNSLPRPGGVPGGGSRWGGLRWAIRFLLTRRASQESFDLLNCSTEARLSAALKSIGNPKEFCAWRFISLRLNNN